MKKQLLAIFTICMLLIAAGAIAQDTVGPDNTTDMMQLQAGERTTVTGLANIVSPNAFSLTNVAYADTAGGDLLIFPGSGSNFALDVNNGLPVQVTGEIVSFDIAEIENRSEVDLDDNAFGDFDTNDWALIATSVQPLLSSQATDADYAAYAENLQADPTTYFDRTVWARGTADIVSPNVFRLENTSPFTLDGDVLVIPGMNGEFSIDINNGLPVSVFGTLMAYDAATLEADYGLDLDEDALADFDNTDYAIVAESVGRWINLNNYATTAGMGDSWSDLGLNEISTWDVDFANNAGFNDSVGDDGYFYDDSPTDDNDLTGDTTVFDNTAGLDYDDVDPYDLLDQITDTPEEFYGSYVYVAGSVEATEFDPLGSFVIVEDDLIGDDPVLVIPRSPDGFTADAWPVDEDVAVTGWVRQYVLTDLEADLGYELDETLYVGYENYPVIIAESVTNAE